MKLYLAATTFALSAFAIGCHSWRPLPVEPREALSHYRRSTRLELTDGRTVTLTDIKVVGDTVFGSSETGQRITRAPLADVRRVLALQPDSRRTRYAVAAGAAAAGVGIMAVIMVETFKTPKTILDPCPDLCP